MFTENLKEALSIAGTPIHAASHNSTTNTGTVDMSKFHRVTFFGDVGTLGSSATLDASLYESDNANGAAPNSLIAGTSITQISTANLAWSQELRADQMTKRYVLCSTVNAIAASVFSVLPIGAEARNKPANTNDDASVTQRQVKA